MTKSLTHTIVAIDGPAASGKSTVARQLASRLGIHYVSSGLFYRAITYKCLEKNIPYEDEDQVVDVMKGLTFSFKNSAMLINEEDLTLQLTTQSVNNNVSYYCKIPAIRELVNVKLRELGQNYSIIMDGRDIGTVVFPKATAKIFLTASVEVRANRRLLELEEKFPGQSFSLNTIKEELMERDQIDSTRETAPLSKAENAIVVDNSDLSIDETLNKLQQLVENKS